MLAGGSSAAAWKAELLSAAGAQAGVPVNVIDKPAFCDFAFGAIVNRSPLVIGISTDGAAPAFAQAIRARLEMLLPKGFAAWAAAAQHWRSAVKAAELTFPARCAFWRLFAKHAVTHAESAPTGADLGRLIAAVQKEGAAAENGSVIIVDAPADPD
jgi:uroporphyrin-III C-methyltransferase / precorrin-2 dehydrogenase / sirohydrochlorin ferrochelatase